MKSVLCYSFVQDDMQAKKVHIHMCIHKAVTEDTSAWGDRYLALMARYTYFWAGHCVKPPVVDAINRALPGRLQGNIPYTNGCAYVNCQFIFAASCLFCAI